MQAPFLALGSCLYGFALLSPLLLNQVSAAVVVAAILGTGLLLFGLHVRWSRPAAR